MVGGVTYRLEGNPRPHRLFREDHGHRLALEGLEGSVAVQDFLLHGLRSLQHLPDLVSRPVVDVEKVLVPPAGALNVNARRHGVCAKSRVAQGAERPSRPLGVRWRQSPGEQHLDTPLTPPKAYLVRSEARPFASRFFPAVGSFAPTSNMRFRISARDDSGILTWN